MVPVGGLADTGQLWSSPDLRNVRMVLLQTT